MKSVQYIYTIWWKDVTFFGSISFYLFMTMMYIALGYTTLARNLVIALLLAYVLGVLLRIAYYKKRPDKQKYSSFAERIDSSSFPSFHTLQITMLGIMSMLTIPIAYVRFLFAAVILIVALSRYMLKRHDAIDIIGGLAMGSIIAWLVVYF